MRKERKGLKRKSISRKSAFHDRIEREGFAPSLKKRAIQGVSPAETMGGETPGNRKMTNAKREKNEKRKKRMGKEE